MEYRPPQEADVAAGIVEENHAVLTSIAAATLCASTAIPTASSWSPGQTALGGVRAIDGRRLGRTSRCRTGARGRCRSCSGRAQGTAAMRLGGGATLDHERSPPRVPLPLRWTTNALAPPPSPRALRAPVPRLPPRAVHQDDFNFNLEVAFARRGRLMNWWIHFDCHFAYHH